MPRPASRFAKAAGAALAALALGGAAASAQTAAGPPAAFAVPGAPSALASDRIYFVMPDRYANGDPSNDTGGVTGNRSVTVHGLARIKSLGFNAIWVTPAVVNQVSQGESACYRGYWGVDFTRVDPHLG